MAQKSRPDPDSELGRLLADLYVLRGADGLRRPKLERADALCALPVIQSEAQRLNRSPGDVAYKLLECTVKDIEEPYHRRLLMNAFALDGRPALRPDSPRWNVGRIQRAETTSSFRSHRP